MSSSGLVSLQYLNSMREIVCFPVSTLAGMIINCIRPGFVGIRLGWELHHFHTFQEIRGQPSSLGQIPCPLSRWLSAEQEATSTVMADGDIAFHSLMHACSCPQRGKFAEPYTLLILYIEAYEGIWYQRLYTVDGWYIWTRSSPCLGPGPGAEKTLDGVID